MGHSGRQSSDLKAPRKSLGILLFARHFLLLTCFSVLLGILAKLRLSSDLSVSFALYGALHASALVLALRVRQPLWRKCLFIVAAASLTLVTLRVGTLGMQLSGALPGNGALYAVAGVSAAAGAVTYGMLIRLVGFYTLTLSSLAEIATGCMLATCVAVFTLAHFHSLGRWWLAVLWWYAFSGGIAATTRRAQP